MALIYDENIATEFSAFHKKELLSKPNVTMHFHPCYELFVCMSNQLPFMINGEHISLVSGDLILMNDQDLHQSLPAVGETYERLVIIFQPLMAWTLISEKVNLLSIFRRESFSERIIHLDPDQVLKMKQYVSSYESIVCHPDQFGFDIRLKLLLANVLLDVNEWSEKQNNSVRPTHNVSEIECVLTYIHKNLDKHIDLDTLAAKFHRHKNRLNDAFKNYTGFSIYQYIIQSRIAKARHCFTSGLSVSETALQCGYTNLSHFCRLFKHINGLTPTEFIKKTRIGQPNQCSQAELPDELN